MKAVRLAFASLVAIAGITAATIPGKAQAQGQPQVVQIACDTLSFNPPRVRVTFSIINLSPIPICSLHMFPIPSGPFEPCEIFECSVPPEWRCALGPGGGAIWEAVPGTPNGCVRPFEKRDGFDIIIDPPYCCYRVAFDDPNHQIFADGIACFNCESPVPTKSSSWGSVKIRYR